MANKYLKNYDIKIEKDEFENAVDEAFNKKAKDITKRDADLLVLDWKRNGFTNKGINDRIGFLRSICPGSPSARTHPSEAHTLRPVGGTGVRHPGNTHGYPSFHHIHTGHTGPAFPDSSSRSP